WLPTSLYVFHITKPHTPTNANPRKILDRAMRLNVCLNNLSNTHETMSNGPKVSKPSTIINVVAALPSYNLVVKSLAKITKEVAPCSKESTKNTVKNTKIITTNILSLSTLLYLKILEIVRNKNSIKPIRMIT